MTNIQTWPLNIDFTIAVQNPHLCFSDPDLKQANTAKNSRGRVLLWSGNFATVYKLTQGDRAWAVRCFTRVPQSDVQQRYSLISEHLQQHPIPYLVNFKFIAQGILVNGFWYPILKMDWVEGTEIDRYIGEYIDDSQVLLRLDRQLQELRQDLQNIGIAHGDLQHGNIMVDESGELKLVDYDGMYVPALQGKPPLEVGHPNYQPPQRSTEDFGDRLDEFSFEVISLSLRALANQPDLWKNFHEDNKNLIFRQNDFQEPDQSPVFRSISQINDDETRELCDRLILRCQGKNEPLTTPKSPNSKLPLIVIGSLLALLTAGTAGYGIWRSLQTPQIPPISSPLPPATKSANPSPEPTPTIATPAPLKPMTVSELLARYNTGQRDFRGTQITGSPSDRLQGKNLQNINLRGSVIERVDLREVILQNANLEGTTIIRADLRGADLSKASLIDANLSLSNLVDVNLSQANLLRANLSQTKFNAANLQSTDLTRADLQKADLSGADLSFANLVLADLRGANLQKTNLRNSNLGAASLNRAALEGADLSMASLRSADLELANLSNANFSNADLTAAKLILAEFVGTNFRSANFDKAIVENISSSETADFTNVTNLDPKVRQYFCSSTFGNVVNSDISTKSTLNCP